MNPTNNQDEHLQISAEEASWVASIFSFSVILGSFITGVLDTLGRIRAIILCNIPFLFEWLYLHYSTSVYDIYIVFGFVGLYSGCMKSAIFNYFGELAELKVRRILAVTITCLMDVGSALVFVLANKMPWRNTCLIFTAVPLADIFLMFFVQNRNEDALKSLKWLRWVDASDAKVEFENLQRYTCLNEKNESVHCNQLSKEIFSDRARELFHRKNLIPFGILSCIYANALFCSNFYRPYIALILEMYNSPIDPNKVLECVGYISMATILITMVCICLFGKRIIHLTALAITILTTYSMGIYGFYFLDHNQTDQHYFPTLLLSELYSYRCKSIVSGIAVA